MFSSLLINRCRTLLALPLLAAACCGPGPSDPGDGDPGQCAAGLSAHGPACVPVLDDCKENEVALLGGGCKRVGIEECPGGLAGPPDWTCRPIGPPTTCLPGFTKVKEGWCEPVLPSVKCPKGMREEIGKTDCQPVGSCGTGTYGNIAITPQTIFVDRSYTGGGSNGTLAKPFNSLVLAVKNAPPGARLAIAAGEYQEDLPIAKKTITLEGRCPQMVVIAGRNLNKYATVEAVLGEVTLVGLTVRGGPMGILGWESKLKVREVVVEQATASGITIWDGSASIERSLVDSNAGLGVIVTGGTASLSQVTVRDTQPFTSDGTQGTGILAMQDKGAPKITLRDCVVLNNRKAGLAIMGAEALIERSTLRNTQPDSAKKDGYGLMVFPQPVSGALASATVRDTLVAGNRTSGVLLDSSRVVIERTVVRNTQVQLADGLDGFGLQVTSDDSRSNLSLRDSAIVGNVQIGVAISGSEVALERTIVQGTLPPAAPTDLWSAGIAVSTSLTTKQPSKVVLREVLLAGNSDNGLELRGSEALIERSMIRGTAAPLVDSRPGSGIRAHAEDKPSALTIKDSAVVRNPVLGVGIYDSTLTMERSTILDTLPDQRRLYGLGMYLDGDKRASSASLTDCVLSRNRAMGLVVINSKAALTGTTVRDTRPLEATGNGGVLGEFGDGIDVHGESLPTSLTLRASRVVGNRTIGVVLFGASGLIESSAIKDTRERASDKLGGVGLIAQEYTGKKRGSDVVMRDSLLSGSGEAGAIVSDSSLTMERTQVLGTRGGPGGIYGDGIQVQANGAAPATLQLESCAIEDSQRAGVLFFGAGGAVRGTVFRRNAVACDLEQAASPQIEEGNTFEENGENGVTLDRGLTPAPAPTPVIPSL